MKKSISIVLLCSLIDFLGHGLTSKIAPFRSMGSPSIISRSIGSAETTALWIVIAFSLIAFWYYKYEKNIFNPNINKGLRLGSAVGMLWLIGMIESDVMSTSTSFIAESVMGLCDAVPILLLVVLLNKFANSHSDINNTESMSYSPSIINKINIAPIITFTVIFLIMRTIFYSTKLITPGYEVKSIPTLLWTISMGAAIGIFYLLLKESIKGKSIFLRAMNFGFIAFGIPWFIFLAFVPILFEGQIIVILIRCLCDGISAFIGYYLCEGFLKQ